MARETRATTRKKGAPRIDGATDVTIPKSGIGNSKWDQQWIEENKDLLVTIDDDDGVPFGTRQAWTGDPEDVGSEWQIPQPKDRCVGKSFIRDGDGRRILGPDGELLTRHCHRWPLKGSKVCFKHGGGIERVKEAALTRMIGAVDAVTGRLIHLSLSSTVEPKVQVQAINSLLDRAGMRATANVQVVVPEWQTMLRTMFEGEPAPAPAPAHTVGVTKPRARRSPAK